MPTLSPRRCPLRYDATTTPAMPSIGATRCPFPPTVRAVATQTRRNNSATSAPQLFTPHKPYKPALVTLPWHQTTCHAHELRSTRSAALPCHYHTARRWLPRTRERRLPSSPSPPAACRRHAQVRPCRASHISRHTPASRPRSRALHFTVTGPARTAVLRSQSRPAPRLSHDRPTPAAQGRLF